jgi:hypothetical protein
LAKSFSLLFPDPRFSGCGRKLPIGHVWCALRDFAAVANLQQSAQFVLAFALLHLSGHRSVI